MSSDTIRFLSRMLREAAFGGQFYGAAILDDIDLEQVRDDLETASS